jgi:tRNA A37 methylthiotransferase MiaB
MLFCVDTSAWLDGWVRDYPQDVFPSLWAKLAEHAESSELRCAEEVYVELSKKDDGIHDWIKARKHIVVPIDLPIQACVSDILAVYPRLVDTKRNRSQADPFVIATALCLGSSVVVVSGEKPRGNLDSPSIPDVCAARNLECIGFLEMIRRLGWRF